jgi:transcriptional regulator of stress and heat shock response
MPTLSDSIEEYLKKLLALSSRYYVDIQRHELAHKFSCAPSQINYVLGRRFSPERGYLIESRRGGRGYIRIYKIDPLQNRTWEAIVDQLTSANFEPGKASQFLKRSSEEKIITRREARMLESLLKDDHYTGLPVDAVQVRELQKKLFQAAMEEVLKGCY